MKYILLTDKSNGLRRLVNLQTDSFEEVVSGVKIHHGAPGFWFACTESFEQVCRLIKEAGGQIGGSNKSEYDAID